MEQDRKLELIDPAIHKKFLHGQDDNNNKVQESIDLNHGLSKKQLEVLKGDGNILKQCEACSPPEIQKTESENERLGNSENEEIMKELKKVKRQNFVTHCLLSVMIALTLTWQLSEVSLLLKVKDGVSHPFRSFGNMLKGMVKIPDGNANQDDNKENPIESSSLPSLKIPDMPHVDVPHFSLQNGQE
ncbi:hypothetical protein RJT34_10491 [Clitoria ternatea]|uniref:Uncharacterized protein n=1 Tax=Clitoria ternatea TaxID=43366 RepID=A0AAN9KA12_CLITE